MKKIIKLSSKGMNYIVKDKITGEVISPKFATKEDAEIWCEEEVVDYDYFVIAKE